MVKNNGCTRLKLKIGFMTPENIKKLRTALKLTQHEFGKIVGVSANTVSRWERKKTKINSEMAMKFWLLAEEKNIDLPKTMMEEVEIFSYKSMINIVKHQFLIMQCQSQQRKTTVKFGQTINFELPKRLKEVL